ncbi:MAG: hypothetical protein ABI452_04420 [Candidatus Limnocylindrales bacterium]
MARHKLPRRTPLQASADRAAEATAGKLASMLKDGRVRYKYKQSDAADRAGMSRGRWADLETGRGGDAPIATWSRAAFAVGGTLDAWIKQTSATTPPKDAVHLRNQELVLRLSISGAWTALAEEFLDREARTSRAADVLLTRRSPNNTAQREYALWDVTDWIEDAGAVVRDFTRRLDGTDRYAVARMQPNEPVPHTAGCWLVRATRRNRELVAQHRHFFRGRFPGSGRAWLAALTTPTAPLPKQPALLWVSVTGTRITASRLNS